MAIDDLISRNNPRTLSSSSATNSPTDFNFESLSEPIAEARPQVDIIIHIGKEKLSIGRYFSRFEFKAMVNGGYIIKANVFDAHFNIHSRLMELGYFNIARRQPVRIDFRIMYGPETDSFNSKNQTKVQSAVLVSFNILSDGNDKANLVLIAVDPPSYFLNMGDASGRVLTGTVSQAIEQIIEIYAPEIQREVSKTNGSDKMKWYMMRQDPKTFIKSLTEWSSSLTLKKTNWLTAADGYSLKVKEQAEWISRQRAYYRFMKEGRSSIKSCTIVSDNGLSVVQSKLVTQGTSAVAGRYLDPRIDVEKLSVMPRTTPNKKVAQVTDWQSYREPTEGLRPPLVGFSSIKSIPEIGSGGDLGVDYEDYIDGRARQYWLDMNHRIIKAKFTILGHGEWDSNIGLGVDTIFVRWSKEPTTVFGVAPGPDDLYWVTGNWLVYGFHHTVTRKKWDTDIFCSRYDYVTLNNRS
jgi:hypothetical protein